MAAPMNPGVITPRRTYILNNSCVICGFSFIVKEQQSDGTVKVTKHLNRKLRLFQERLNILTYVVGDVQVSDNSANGVCVKCFQSTERVIKLEKEAKKLKDELLLARNEVVDVNSDRRTNVEKRLLKSPGTSQPLKISTGMKENSNFPVYVRPLSLSHLKPFSDITNSARTFVNIAPRSEKETIVPKQKAMRSLEQDFSTDTCMEGVVKVYLISCTFCLLLFFIVFFFFGKQFFKI